ncbi:MAG: hypothetical protein IEMM0002_1378 [bacterium]|nr:MAG: hypothetical protein IEMM0002_1378 [bacterium]
MRQPFPYSSTALPQTKRRLLRPDMPNTYNKLQVAVCKLSARLIEIQLIYRLFFLFIFQMRIKIGGDLNGLVT